MLIVIEQCIGYVVGALVIAGVVLVCWIDARRQDLVDQAKRGRK